MGLHLLGTQVRARAAGLPIILIWSGPLATIPVGFRLCDGTHGTPDLRDQFIIPADDPSNPRSGPDVSSGPNNRDRGHSHPLFNTVGEPDPLHTHTSPSWTTLNTSGVLAGTGIPILVGGDHTHNVSTYNVGPAQTAHYHQMNPTPPDTDVLDARPPYYALAFIQGPIDSAPLGTIVNFVGTPAASFLAGPILTSLDANLSSSAIGMAVNPPLDIGARSTSVALVKVGAEIILVYSSANPSFWSIARHVNGVVASHSLGDPVVGSRWAYCTGAQGTPSIQPASGYYEFYIVGAGGSYAVGDTGGSNVITGDRPAHVHGAGSATVDDEAAHVHRQKISDPSAPNPPVGNPAEVVRDGTTGVDDATSATTAQTLVALSGAIVANGHKHAANAPGAVGTVDVPDTLAGTAHAHNPLVATNPAFLTWNDNGTLPSGYFAGFLQKVA